MTIYIQDENSRYTIDDTVLKNRPDKVFVEEIPSLRVNYDKTEDTEYDGVLYNLSVPHFLQEFQTHDSNIVSVCSFPPFPKTDRIKDFVLCYIKSRLFNKDTKVFFDNLYEGHVTAPIVGIYKLLSELDVNPKNVYLFTCGMQAEKMHEEYCKENNITDMINIRVINVWERHVYKRPEDGWVEPIYTTTKKDKLFLCFNRIARKQRVALLGLLYSKNLVDRAFYSFFPSMYQNASYRFALDSLQFFLSNRSQRVIREHIDLHDKEFPLLLNTNTVEDNVNYVKADDDQYYQNSYFSLVTETFFFKTSEKNSKVVDENSVFFSEKIFKPIICKHPFIMMNRPYSLEYLRKIGYKTFAPFIDETYDTIEDDEDRLLAVVNEVERLSKMTDDEWIAWQENVRDIVEHNYKVITSKTILDHGFIDD